MKNFFLVLLIAATSKVIASENNSYTHFIDGSALVVFEEAVTELQRQDVLESTLYAQLMASHDNNRFNEFSDWYQSDIDYLEEVGWKINLSKFKVINDNSSSTYKEVIQNTLKKDFDESEMKLLMESIGDLSSNHSVAHTLFTNESSKGIVHNFQILLVKLNIDTSLIITYTGFVLSAFNKTSTQMFASTGLGLLNNGDYKTYREGVSKYLGSYAKTLIQEY